MLNKDVDFKQPTATLWHTRILRSYITEVTIDFTLDYLAISWYTRFIIYSAIISLCFRYGKQMPNLALHMGRIRY